MVELGLPDKVARSRAASIVSAVQSIDKKLPGELRLRDAAKQGMTLGQLYQRINSDLQQAEMLEE